MALLFIHTQLCIHFLGIRSGGIYYEHDLLCLCLAQKYSATSLQLKCIQGYGNIK